MRIDLVVPVLNEEVVLPRSIPRLVRACQSMLPEHHCRVIIADNGSTDRTREISHELAQQHPEVRYSSLQQRGRGLALRFSWMGSDADILAYMDADLSTDLGALPTLIGTILGGDDLCIGSRHLPASRCVRGLKRDLLSGGYVKLISAAFPPGFSDAQCGFKAITRSAARAIVPLIQDNGWFFDTELLVLARRLGYRISEIPVHWVEDADSRVHILKTVSSDLAGLLRLRFGGLKRAAELHGVEQG